jgi:hypothetical protein
MDVDGELSLRDGFVDMGGVSLKTDYLEVNVYPIDNGKKLRKYCGFCGRKKKYRVIVKADKQKKFEKA